MDVIAWVRHAIDPTTPLAPIGRTVDERFQQRIADKQEGGVTFTDDQRKWLDAIKNHIASSLAIGRDDLEDVPFNSIGGLGRAISANRWPAKPPTHGMPSHDRTGCCGSD